jgi:hypothetical protein
MSSKKKILEKGRIPGAWTPIRHEPMNSAAWKHVSFGARLLYIALLRRLSFTNYNNGHVYLSTRKAAEEIGTSKTTIVVWFRELQHYGFITLVEPGTRGARGRAAHWRITDMGWGQLDGAPVTPTKDYLIWSGELFSGWSKNNSKGQVTGTPCTSHLDTPVPATGTVPIGAMSKPLVHSKAKRLSKPLVHTKSHHLPLAEGGEDAAADAVETSARRSESAIAVDEAPAGIGHNAGPPLTDERPAWTTPVLTEIPYTDELRQLYAATESVNPLPDDGLTIPTFLRRA